MKGIIAWFCRNGVAANLLMCGILSMGIALLLGSFPVKQSENPKFHKFQQDIAGFLGAMPTEVFPDFELDILEIGVEYRGATPAEVEESIVVKIEEAIQDLEGIKKISSSSAEGAGAVTVEVESDYEVREMLDDVKNRVDAISTFPDLAEKPIVRVAQRSSAVITVVLSAEMDEAALRTLGELTRDEIANLPKITQVSLGAVRPYEIGIEVSEETLQRYGLTLAAVARAVSQTSIDLPAGSIKTRAGEILLRTKGQAYVQEDFEKIVLLTREDGTRLTLGEIANVRDGFEEEPLFATFNGKPCVLINVARVGDQNAIELAQIVKDYMDQKRASLPSGVSIDYWNDRSRIVAGRLDTLLKSAWWGMWFVILVLALFLRPSVAIWVFLGIPISFAGAIMLMPLIGVSFNIFSLFAFILVLGIVVDDAIVTGENVFTHLENAPAGTDGTDAAIKGTQEVAVPVVFGILTTVVAFVPLLMIEGTRGKIFAQISLVIIPVLLFSLVESKLILPAHLKHLATGRKKASELNFLYRFQRLFADGLEMFVLKVYRPTLAVASAHRYITLSLFIGTATIIFALVASTRVQFVYFPRVESETATATLTMPLGTPSEATQRYVTLIREKAEALQEKYT
ncbi:MAG: multidrug efflux pump subunit AcrB, partial [Candidatus Binatia bacterium]